MHDIRFPGESPEYRVKRNELLEAEISLRANIEKVAKLRRELPKGGEILQDYVFDEIVEGEICQTKVSDLFSEGKNTLILYSFMYGPENKNPCVMCNSFLDGINGNIPHIEENVNFAVVAKSPIDRIVQWGQQRNWTHIRLLSSNNNTYNQDYFGENEGGGQLPTCNVFVKEEGRVFHFYSSEVLFVPTEGNPRHMDLLWPVWNALDLTPEGRGEWYPALNYS